MPLRSVEAATRDDAIAAAREQFGPTARVVGVRRVRSGGVLGFFATERYVAEVDPDSPGRPARKGAQRTAAPATPNASLEERARAAAAEIARLTAAGPDPVDEVAGLLAGETAAEPLPTYTRSSFQRAAAESAKRAAEGPAARAAAKAARTFTPAAVTPGSTVRERRTVETDDEGPVIPASGASPSPSPFTAALARMVSGDREVRQAVQDALEPADDGRSQEPARPNWAAIVRAAEKTAQQGAPHQEEEPVDEQSEQSPGVRPMVFPAWAAEPVETPAETPAVATTTEPAPASSAREERIADILRAALAQGQSDEALADILRTVLAGPSPAGSLAAEPTPVARVAEPAPEPVAELTVETPTWETAVDSAPLWGAPAPAPAPEWADVAGGADRLDIDPLDIDRLDADRLDVDRLDGDRLDSAADEPVFAEVVLHEPAAETPRTPSVLAAEAPVELPVIEPVIEAPVEVEQPVAETPVVAQPVAVAEAEPIVETVAEPVAVVEAEPVVEPVAEAVVEAEPVAAALPMPPLARTASDPAPLPLDATTVMPPLSLLPPLPSAARHRGGRPPVPPPSRPTVPSPRAPESAAPATAPVPAPAPAAPLATVVRLPFAPLPDVDYVEPGEPAAPETEVEETAMPQPQLVEPVAVPSPVLEPVVEAAPVAPPVVVPEPVAEQPAPVVAPPAPADLVARLVSFGIPEHLLGAGFAAEAAAHGTYAALTSALAARLPVAPALPTGPGEVLFLVGPGVETLRAARSLAAGLRLDPDRVQWATRGDLAALAPKGSRMATIDAAIERRQDAARAGTMTIVAVDAPLRTDAYWIAQMLAIWGPAAVWAVVEATRKPEDLEQWLEGLPRVDALVVQDSDLSADPAAVLARLDTPVALLDGVPATAHRWASLLCERLEKLQA